MINIIGISGSLRKESYNKALLEASKNLFPEEISMEITDIGSLPLYNDDLIPDHVPPYVHEFRTQISTSDGILIACPEYNYSMTGVLKNALDWAATNSLGNVLDGKPTAIMGASKNVFGTVRAQLHLRQVLAAVNAKLLQRPEVFIRQAQKVISDNGQIEDERTIKKLETLNSALIELIHSDR